MNDFQDQLRKDKMRGFEACKTWINLKGIDSAKFQVSIKNLSSEEASKDAGFWRGWLQACLSNSIQGA